MASSGYKSNQSCSLHVPSTPQTVSSSISTNNNNSTVTTRECNRLLHNPMSSAELNKFIDLNLDRLNRLKIRRTHVVADSLERIKSNSIENVYNVNNNSVVASADAVDLKVESAKLFQKISNNKELASNSKASPATPSFCRSLVNNLPMSKPLKMKNNLFK